jgi:hypothetical protein
LGEYLGHVFEASCFGLANTGAINAILAYATYCTVEEDDCGDDGSSVFELLTALAKHASPVIHLPTLYLCIVSTQRLI